jgi:hypothetical protein
MGQTRCAICLVEPSGDLNPESGAVMTLRARMRYLLCIHTTHYDVADKSDRDAVFPVHPEKCL